MSAAPGMPAYDDFGLTPEFLRAIKRWEGFVPHVYKCPAGYPTIGYGHRVPAMSQRTITEPEAAALLLADLREKRDLMLAFSPHVAQEPAPRCAALTDFCFNIGEGAYQYSTLRKAVAARDWSWAAMEMCRWTKAHVDGKLVTLSQLVARRAVCAHWLEEGK